MRKFFLMMQKRRRGTSPSLWDKIVKAVFDAAGSDPLLGHLQGAGS